LKAVKISLDKRTKSLQENLLDMTMDLHEEKGLMFQVEAQTMKALRPRCQFQTQLKKTKTRAKRERRTGTSVGMAKPSKFDRTTSWDVFQSQLKTVGEHNCWTHLEKYTYLITALHGQVTDILHRVLKGATNEETLQTLEEHFGDQHLDAAHHCQLKMRTQGVRESLQ
jgi:hypothetical protein